MVSPTTPATGSGPLFQVGTHVLNFGQLGKVTEVCDNGDLILRSVGLSGDWSKWRASASKCVAWPSAATTVRHAEGLVEFWVSA